MGVLCYIVAKGNETLRKEIAVAERAEGKIVMTADILKDHRWLYRMVSPILKAAIRARKKASILEGKTPGSQRTLGSQLQVIQNELEPLKEDEGELKAKARHFWGKLGMTIFRVRGTSEKFQVIPAPSAFLVENEILALLTHEEWDRVTRRILDPRRLVEEVRAGRIANICPRKLADLIHAECPTPQVR